LVKLKQKFIKHSITQFSLPIIAFVAITFLMSYARPVAEEPEQYPVVFDLSRDNDNPEKFEQKVAQKLTEGWRLQGGMRVNGTAGGKFQAMVK